MWVPTGWFPPLLKHTVDRRPHGRVAEIARQTPIYYESVSHKLFRQSVTQRLGVLTPVPDPVTSKIPNAFGHKVKGICGMFQSFFLDIRIKD
jgi:hypothetical protein